MTRRAATALLLVASAIRAGAQAAPEVRLDAGYARVTQSWPALLGGTESSDAALFAVFWRRPTERFTLFTSANLTYARDSLAAAQGVAAFSFPWVDQPHLQTDVGLAFASFSLRSAGSGGNGYLFGRQHYVRDDAGAWLGAAGGVTRRDGRRRQSYAADLGAWARWRLLYGSISLARQASDDFLLLLANGDFGSPRARMYELEDWQFVLQARRGPHEVTASYTTRRPIAGADSTASAIHVSGTLQLSDGVSFLASAGRQLADPLRGLPEADLLTASLRISFGPKPLPVMQRSSLAQVRMLPHPGGGADVAIRAPASDTVAIDIAADFSQWHPLPKVREGDEWVVRVTLPPGKYKIGVRANLGPWRAPRNLARVRDDFGGESGLLVVP